MAGMKKSEWIRHLLAAVILIFLGIAAISWQGRGRIVFVPFFMGLLIAFAASLAVRLRQERERKKIEESKNDQPTQS
jgi:hypothetical protein